MGRTMTKRHAALIAPFALALAACAQAGGETGGTQVGAAGAPAGAAFGAAAPTMAAGAAQAPVRAFALPPGTLRLQKAQIIDPSGFDRPMVAATMLIPAGYRPQGGIAWNLRARETCGIDYSLEWSATSPDGLGAVGFTTPRRWNATQSADGMPLPLPPACTNAAFSSAREFLEGWARNAYPDMRVLDYRERPDLAAGWKPFADLLMEVQAQIPVRNMEKRSWADGGELLIARTVNGTEVRETIATGVMITHTRWTDYMNPGRVSNETIEGMASGLRYVRAPAGQLDFRLADVMSASMMAAPEWSRLIAKHNAAQAGITMEGMTEQHKVRMEGMRAVERIRAGQYEAKVLLEDRMQRERIESIRGVETYAEPETGGAVQLSNQYDHAWRLRDDTYVLTNDPNFDPTRFGVEARKLEALP